MRKFRTSALGALSLALVLVLSACGTGGGAQPTAAANPTAAAKPATPAGTVPVASPAAKPSPAGSPGASPVASAVPAASPAASPVAATGPKPTVKMGSTNFGEQVILAELYSQILEANGYTVERHLNLGNREVVFPALQRGEIDVLPEYLATALSFVDKNAKASTDPADTRTKLGDALKPMQLSVLDFAPAVDTNGFVVTKATADRLNLKKLSDVTAAAGNLVLGGPPECPDRPFCAAGLESVYGIKFKDFKPLDAGGPLTVAALDANQIDVALLFTSDAVITQKGYVLLDDDKHLQLADNVAPVVRDDLLSKAPADFRTLLGSVNAKLTTDKLTQLNKQVGIDRMDAKDVAAGFLKAEGLVK